MVTIMVKGTGFMGKSRYSTEQVTFVVRKEESETVVLGVRYKMV